MAATSGFGVTQHGQIFSLFFRNRIQCTAVYQLYNSQALLNLRRGYYSHFKATVILLVKRSPFLLSSGQRAMIIIVKVNW